MWFLSRMRKCFPVYLVGTLAQFMRWILATLPGRESLICIRFDSMAKRHIWVRQNLNLGFFSNWRNVYFLAVLCHFSEFLPWWIVSVETGKREPPEFSKSSKYNWWLGSELDSLSWEQMLPKLCFQASKLNFQAQFLFLILYSGNHSLEGLIFLRVKTIRETILELIAPWSGLLCLAILSWWRFGIP